jgi:hypothetical protein
MTARTICLCKAEANTRSTAKSRLFVQLLLQTEVGVCQLDGR